MDDILRELGYLTLGSRLRRVGERLQSSTQHCLDLAGIDVPAAQLTVLAALDRLGACSIGELALALRQTQPGVTRMVGKLQMAGLVTSQRGAEDQRLRHVDVSVAGRRLVDRCKRTVWPAVEAALASECAALDGTLLEQLAGFEAMLASGRYETRVRKTL